MELHERTRKAAREWVERVIRAEAEDVMHSHGDTGLADIVEDYGPSMDEVADLADSWEQEVDRICRAVLSGDMG